MNCPRVTGWFSLDALSQQDDHWWGGQKIGATNADLVARVPEEIRGWKRQLAEEYLRSYRGGVPLSGNPPPRPAPTVAAPVAAPTVVALPTEAPQPQQQRGGNNRRRR